jgi:hypothetical protein
VAGDEQVRAQATGSRPAVELTAAESWRLLAGASLGRIVFTQHAMPAIRPVNHLVDDETVIRSHLGAAITGRAAVSRYQQLLRPWADGQMDNVIAIEPQLITGLRLAGWCR